MRFLPGNRWTRRVLFAVAGIGMALAASRFVTIGAAAPVLVGGIVLLHVVGYAALGLALLTLAPEKSARLRRWIRENL